MLRILRRSIPVSLVFCLTSCRGGGGYGGGSSDDDPPPPPPAAVASVSVSPGELTLLAGASLQLAATTLDEAGNELLGRAVTWTTSDSAIATVSEDGLVEGVGAGAVTITATSEEQSGDATIVVVSSVTLASVVAGGAHSCGLTTDAAAFCWGRAESGQLGVAPPTAMCLLDSGAFPCSLSPLGVVGGVEFAQLATGGAHTCGLTSDGTAYCWGSNVAGQLGDDTTTDRFTPEPVDTDLSFVTIDAGANHTCGLTSDGAAYCWGLNNRGQLGDGTTTQRAVPVAVTGGHTFELLLAGGFDIGQTCGLTSSGDA
jgi:alpha-tubulin suppressor-like RCC1 family protein